MASASTNRQPTANRGGASSIATPANSGGSGIFGGGDVGAAHGTADDATKNQPATSSGAAGGKRQSQDGGSMFGNISNLKRNSADQSGAQRKASMSEQRPEPGVIGKMWNNFTKGA